MASGGDRNGYAAAPAVLARDVAGAFALLTRIPAPHAPQDRAAAGAWAWPLAGLAPAAAGAAALALCGGLGLSPVAGAALAVGAALLITGALHEDGFADCADGFGGGATPQRRLEIMRDSRVGAFGAAALSLALVARVGMLADAPSPAAAAAALAAVETLSRAPMAALLRAGPPARPGGLAAWVGRPPMAATAAGGALALGVAALAAGVGAAAAAALAAAAAAAATLALARRRIGGVTGDVLGAAQVAASLAALAALTAD